MSDCQHHLPLKKKMFASKGKGRVCSKCGARVFVDLPLFNGILSVTPIPFAIVAAIAWTNGGALWVWLTLALLAHPIIYFVELQAREPREYDYEEHHRNTKRNYVFLAIFVVAAAAFAFWAV